MLSYFVLFLRVPIYDDGVNGWMDAPRAIASSLCEERRFFESSTARTHARTQTPQHDWHALATRDSSMVLFYVVEFCNNCRFCKIVPQSLAIMALIMTFH